MAEITEKQDRNIGAEAMTNHVSGPDPTFVEVKQIYDDSIAAAMAGAESAQPRHPETQQFLPKPKGNTHG